MYECMYICMEMSVDDFSVVKVVSLLGFRYGNLILYKIYAIRLIVSKTLNSNLIFVEIINCQFPFYLYTKVA